MLTTLADAATHLLGLETAPEALSLVQISLRALLIYLAGFALLRFGEHRFLGKNTAFDVVLGFILGSMLSRAINGSGPLAGTMLAGAVLLALHYLFATAAARSGRLRQIIAGHSFPLIKDGAVQKDNLRKNRISESLLREALRIHAHLDDPRQVRAAYYEPSGDISVLPKEAAPAASPGGGGPRIVEVQVEEGVQTVRIVLDA